MSGSRRSRLAISAAVTVGAVGLLWAVVRINHAYRYPYGWSHCCDKALYFALLNYAEAHGGAFPTGEATAEASLSLLYPTYADAELLRGKTVPLETVEALLARGEKLSPETCGWHYVDGLTRGDDGRTALFWDKAGLGHNGERLPDGGRTVFFVSGAHEYVTGTEWPGFLQAQEELAANREGGQR